MRGAAHNLRRCKMFSIRNSFRVPFTPLSVISCLWFSPLLFAEEKEDENKLNPIIVTATRTAQTADETLTSVTVITREDIERSQSQDVAGLLRTVAGIDVARNGGSGNSTSVFMRGTESDHTLVLIDGIRAASASLGTFAFHTLDVSQIERIEIVRGPRASLYGSDAIGGVIQIFTRKSSGVSARIEGGSFGTKKLDVSYGGGDKIKYNLNLSTKDIDGFSSTNSSVFFFNPDKDNFKAESFTFGLKIPASDKLTLNLNSWYNNSKSEFDNGLSIDGVTDSTNKTINLSADYINNDTWTQILSLGHAMDEIQTASNNPSNITTKRKSVDWQHNLVLVSNQLITAGFDYYENQAENISDFAFNEKIDNKAFYTNWQGNLSENILQLGMRIDNHSKFGSETTGQFAWGRKFNTVQVRASLGTAFKAPDMNELFFPGFGNRSIQAETSKTFEIGALHTFSKSHKLDVSLYTTKINNLITSVQITFPPAPITFLAINTNKASIHGLEMAYTLNKGYWTFQTNFTLQDAKDDKTNTPLLRRADQKLALSVSRNIKKTGNISAEILFSSDRPGQNNILPGYGILNLSANYPINKKLTLQGRIDNVSDKQYELVSGYNTANRSVFIALRYQN